MPDRLWPTRSPHAAQANVLCGPVSVSLLCMYKTMTACLYFDHLKFDIFDAIVFTAWWEEAGNSIIDFSPCSRKVWSPIKKLTGRSASSSRLCPVSAYSIASQLMWNGAHKTRDRESTRLVNKQLSDLWKIPTPDGDGSSVPLSLISFLTPSTTWSQENPWD